ncbi:MAG: sugar-binding domain-containing protein [Thermosynechococcaceae cyanobacterium]
MHSPHPQPFSEEISELIELGAVGEIAGWAYDQQGILRKKGTNAKVAGVPLEQPVERVTIAISGGLFGVM